MAVGDSPTFAYLIDHIFYTRLLSTTSLFVICMCILWLRGFMLHGDSRLNKIIRVYRNWIIPRWFTRLHMYTKEVESK